MIEQSDKMITMGCGAEAICPVNFMETEDWALDDPKGKTLEQIRKIKDELKDRVNKLFNEFN
ncbi:hypothetical protein ACFLTT_02135 [Chloroflexota bacterium]